MPETRLIDANDIDVNDISCFYSDMCRLDDVQDLIDSQPTVDAVPVKRGHWIIEKEEPMYGGHKKIWALRCSECGKDPIKHVGGGLSNWWFETPDFCPVCGSYNKD